MADAQQAKKIPRVGFLWDSPAVFPDAIEAFRQGLRDLGYVEGRTIAIEYRWAEGKPERMRELAEELVRLKVDVIMAPSSIYTGAAKQATSTIPIIFMSHADPIGSGHVASLARPGGNITGLSIMMTETNVKGLELLKEAVPGLSRVAVIWDPATPSHGPGLKGRRSRGPITGAPGSNSGRAQRNGVRQRLFRHYPRTRRRGSGPFNPHIHCRGNAASGTRDEAQTAFDVWAETSRGGRGSHELRA
jgi:hypothetical protein